jgi:uncharacterized protein (DUF1800 family)
MQDATHVLNRIGFGPRPGDVKRVREFGIEKYLEQQLRPERIDDDAVESRLSAMPSIRMPAAEILAQYPQPQRLARALGMNPADRDSDERGMRRKLQALYMERGLKPVQQLLQELVAHKIVRAVHSERQLEEVLTDFWFNHFNVFWGKNADRWLTTGFEMNAIRPNVLGKFKGLLMATAKSPAMLFYLDNHLSSAQRGINENYARELMELHTLGVDGGYTQEDVQQVARAFTGWTIDAPQRNGEFLFRPRMHVTGEKIVLGHRLNPGGIRDGEAVIDILAKHPSTSQFISTKLVRRFVSDDPPASLVSRVAGIYRKTDGDIREMMRAIVTSEEFNSSGARKTKSPFEYAVSAIRSLDGSSHGSPQLTQSIARMGQPLYQCQPPTGFPDRGDYWMSDGAVIERLNFAVALCANRIPGTQVRLDEPAKSAVLRLGSPDFQKR